MPFRRIITGEKKDWNQKSEEEEVHSGLDCIGPTLKKRVADWADKILGIDLLIIVSHLL
jgi:hypothetical protein